MNEFSIAFLMTLAWILAWYVLTWYLYRVFGTGNLLGIALVYARKSKWTRWLTWCPIGDDSWYIDVLEEDIADFRLLKSVNTFEN